MAETIGTLVDKMSIMQLKIYHMQEQLNRPDATEDHRLACSRRVEILTTQMNDLRMEMNELAKDVLTGAKKLKVYRQFKMYNDPVYKSKVSPDPSPF